MIAYMLALAINADILHYYRADLVRIVDGDTLRVDIHMTYDVIQKNKSIRLLRINAPEPRGKTKNDGIVSKACLQYLIQGKKLIIKFDKSDGLGRYLSEVWADGINVNDLMVRDKCAVYREYK